MNSSPISPSAASVSERVMKGSPTMFATEMRRLLNDKDSADVRFLVGASRKPFSAHQCILSSRCDFFKAMFAEARSQQRSSSLSSVENDTGPMILSETNPETFAALLEFLYTNCVTLRSNNALDVLAAAVEFGLDDLRRLCFEFLTENLNSNNACELLQAAMSFGQEDLRCKTVEYIEKNASAVFKTRNFSTLSADALSTLLSSDNLMLDELEVIAALRQWANTAVETVNTRRSSILPAAGSEGLAGALKQLRLGLLSADELATVEKDNERERLIPVEMFSEAWKLLALRRLPDNKSIIARPRKGTLKRPNLFGSHRSDVVSSSSKSSATTNNSNHSTGIQS